MASGSPRPRPGTSRNWWWSPSPDGGSQRPGNGAGVGNGILVKGGVVPGPAGLPADLSGFDWVLGMQAMTLKGSTDYVVRDRASGVAYVYPGRKSGVSNRRVLGEGLGAFDLAG